MPFGARAPRPSVGDPASQDRLSDGSGLAVCLLTSCGGSPRTCTLGIEPERPSNSHLLMEQEIIGLTRPVSAVLPIFVGMHPDVRRDLTLLGEPDYVDRWSVPALPARRVAQIPHGDPL